MGGHSVLLIQYFSPPGKEVNLLQNYPVRPKVFQRPPAMILLYKQPALVYENIYLYFYMSNEFTGYYYNYYLPGIPWHLSSKESSCNAGDLASIPGWGRSPFRKAWQPTPVSLTGEFHGQRSLAGYSPWGHKELDTTQATEPACVICL